jgi:hypothetical protein
MISDVLFDAVQAIEDYERSSPRTYADPETTAKIASVKAAMRGLQRELDSAPACRVAMDGPIVTRGSLAEHSMSFAEWMNDMEGDEDLAWRFGGRLLSRGTHDDSDYDAKVVVIYRREGSVAEFVRQMKDWRAGHPEIVGQARDRHGADPFGDYAEFADGG